MLRAWDAMSGTVVAERLRSAHTHWTRLRGLLGTPGLEAGEGLWLRPCRQIHMIGMRYPVDLAFLDARRRVVRTISSLAPGTFSPRVAAADSVLELPAGTVARAGLAEGSRIEIAGGTEADPFVGQRLATLACNLVLALVYVFFASAHFSFAQRTGQWSTTMPIVAQEAMLVLLFLTRRRSLVTSSQPSDWAVAIAGSLLPLFMRAAETAGTLSWMGRPVQMAALLLSLIAIGCLGRSWGIVAANRGVKTIGPYRFVRHPIYTCHLMSYCGYVACYPTLQNVILATLTAVALHARSRGEERLLAEDPVYAEYRSRVRWRFVPYVY